MVTAVCGGIVTSLLRGGGPKRWASPVAWLGDLEAANDVVPDLAVWVEVAVDDTESRYSRASESDGENALLGDVWRAGVFAAPRLARVGEDGALAARCGPCDREEGAGVFDRPFAFFFFFFRWKEYNANSLKPSRTKPLPAPSGRFVPYRVVLLGSPK